MQTVIINTKLAAPPPSKSRKRNLTSMNGVDLDVHSPALPVTREVVEALRLRIIELEDQLSGKQAPKRVKKEEPPVAGPSASSSTVVKVDKKKLDTILKKVWTRLAKEIKSDANKFTGGKEKTIRIDEILELEEFQAIFDGKGHLVQPTPQNKPTSTVTIKTFSTEAELIALFGTNYKELKGNRYATGAFMKAAKIGRCDVEVNLLTITYSKNNMKCNFKFEVDEVGGDDSDCHYRGRVWVAGW